MIEIIVFTGSAILAYLAGAFPTSYIMAKAVKGVDIRQHGSQNVGATNVFRVVGKLPALITLIIDILKGVLVVTLLYTFSYSFLSETIDADFYRAFLGFTAICGHIWPVFLKFKGGKGVATTLGVIAVLSPVVFLVSGAIWIIVFSFSNYVSMASIIMAVSFPIISAILALPFYTTLFCIAVCLVTCYKHKSNIERLLTGRENKTFLFKKVKI